MRKWPTRAKFVPCRLAGLRGTLETAGQDVSDAEEGRCPLLTVGETLTHADPQEPVGRGRPVSRWWGPAQPTGSPCRRPPPTARVVDPDELIKDVHGHGVRHQPALSGGWL